MKMEQKEVEKESNEGVNKWRGGKRETGEYKSGSGHELLCCILLPLNARCHWIWTQFFLEQQRQSTNDNDMDMDMYTDTTHHIQKDIFLSLSHTHTFVPCLSPFCVSFFPQAAINSVAVACRSLSFPWWCLIFLFPFFPLSCLWQFNAFVFNAFFYLSLNLHAFGPGSLHYDYLRVCHLSFLYFIVLLSLSLPLIHHVKMHLASCLPMCLSVASSAPSLNFSFLLFFGVSPLSLQYPSSIIFVVFLFPPSRRKLWRSMVRHSCCQKMNLNLNIKRVDCFSSPSSPNSLNPLIFSLRSPHFCWQHSPSLDLFSIPLHYTYTYFYHFTSFIVALQYTSFGITAQRLHC